MPTFLELQEAVRRNKNQKAILLHLVDYIEQNFRPIAGGDPRNALITDDKQRIPFEEFEETIAGLLVPEIQAIDAELGQVLGATFLASTPAAPAPEPPTEPQAPAPIAAPAEAGQAPAPMAVSTRRRARQ